MSKQPEIHKMWGADLAARRGYARSIEAKGALEALQAMGADEQGGSEAKALKRLLVASVPALPASKPKAAASQKIYPRAEKPVLVGDFVKIGGIQIEVRQALKVEQWVAKPKRIEVDWANVWPFTEIKQDKPLWKRVVDETCAKYGVSIPEVMSIQRQPLLVHARHEIFYRLKKESSMSLPEIGRVMGGRDHTTVLHGVRQHASRLAAENKENKMASAGATRTMAMQVICPHCWAKPLHPCTSKKTGKPRTAIHADRYALAKQIATMRANPAETQQVSK